MRNRIKISLREVLVGEQAMRLGNLPETTGLFIKPINQGATMVLYDPPTKTAYATITFSEHYPSEKIYDIMGVAAMKGYGPFIYELGMMFVNENGGSLMPSREGDIRGDAWNVWERFYKRNDIDKTTFDLYDDEFRFDILTGEDENWYGEDKTHYWDNSSDSEKQSLLAFNTKYSIQPNSDYKHLISVAKSAQAEQWTVRDIADEKGDDLWSSMYDNG